MDIIKIRSNKEIIMKELKELKEKGDRLRENIHLSTIVFVNKMKMKHLYESKIWIPTYNKTNP